MIPKGELFVNCVFPEEKKMHSLEFNKTINTHHQFKIIRKN